MYQSAGNSPVRLWLDIPEPDAVSKDAGNGSLHRPHKVVRRNSLIGPCDCD